MSSILASTPLAIQMTSSVRHAMDVRFSYNRYTRTARTTAANRCLKQQFDREIATPLGNDQDQIDALYQQFLLTNLPYLEHVLDSGRGDLTTALENVLSGGGFKYVDTLNSPYAALAISALQTVLSRQDITRQSTLEAWLRHVFVPGLVPECDYAGYPIK